LKAKLKPNQVDPFTVLHSKGRLLTLTTIIILS
jgi:hypothetical protein